MNEKPEIAIIDANGLETLGMAQLIKEIAPMAELHTFSSFAELMDDTPDVFFHYFVSMQIAVEHSQFFLERKRKTVVLSNGVPNSTQWNGWHIVNICQSKQLIVSDMIKLYSGFHRPERQKAIAPVSQILSAREMEVLSLVVKGFINKEIADKLNISITTVIAHRRNIVKRIGIKSVSGLTIFAIANGVVDANDI